MCPLIAVCCSFIQQFNLNCLMKLLNERRIVHKKLRIKLRNN